MAGKGVRQERGIGEVGPSEAHEECSKTGSGQEGWTCLWVHPMYSSRVLDVHASNAICICIPSASDRPPPPHCPCSVCFPRQSPSAHEPFHSLWAPSINPVCPVQPGPSALCPRAAFANSQLRVMPDPASLCCCPGHSPVYTPTPWATTLCTPHYIDYHPCNPVPIHPCPGSPSGPR